MTGHFTRTLGPLCTGGATTDDTRAAEQGGGHRQCDTERERARERETYTETEAERGREGAGRLCDTGEFDQLAVPAPLPFFSVLEALCLPVFSLYGVSPLAHPGMCAAVPERSETDRQARACV